ncbi:alpha/beta family hydrolase [Candidatus Palauibacter sp.]|uniref:alpha/beta hydrolase family protein n=1 Tax=Candidatus Palauibacter sp. TaxID=3101350 RepID=UPI003B529233
MSPRPPRAAAEVGATDRFAEQAQFVSLRWGEVSALLVRPPKPRAMLAFAHGAGAGIEHPFMSDMAQRLGGQGIATFRYHFPYMEARALSGRRRPPDRPPVLVETVRAAVARAAVLADGLPLCAGGKSMGGRMTSTAAAEAPLPGVAGLVFFGFPLHAPGRPERAAERSAHLNDVSVPMLFLQGTRDALARWDLIEETCASLGPLATLHKLEGADHSFRVLKRSGRTNEEVADGAAARVSAWACEVGPRE